MKRWPSRLPYIPPPCSLISYSDSALTKILAWYRSPQGERRHVPILAYRTAAVSLLQARPEGGTDVRVGPRGRGAAA